MTETLIEYETEKIETQALEITEQAGRLKVIDEKSYIDAGNWLLALKNIRKQIVEKHKKIKERTYSAWKQSCADEAVELKPVDCADKFLREEVNRYLNEQEELRREEQRKAEKAAAAAAEKEKEKLLKQAVKAEEKGNIEKAEALLEKAEVVYKAPIIIPSAVEKTTRLESGTLTRKSDIQITITDALLFVKSIAEKRVPLDAVEFKLNNIKSWAKKNNVKGGQIPGLLVKEIQVMTL